MKLLSVEILSHERTAKPAPMRKIFAFYAWQSDRPENINRNLIDIALREAATRINQDASLGVELHIDSDTEGVPGNPPVTDTILKKIDACDIFIPDVTFVASTDAGKLIPNPNVMTEFGYALRSKSHFALMLLMNTFYGPPESLPFDLGHLRHPIKYSADPEVKDAERRAIRNKLSKTLEEKLRLQIAATQPPPPAPARFSRAEAKDPPARFRAPGQPIGKVWSGIPLPNAPSQNVTLAKAPAIWLRLMPVNDPGRIWPATELKKHAIPSGQFNLAPFLWTNVFTLRAEDGIAMCSLAASDEIETPSVAFAFETGEIWSIDTTLMSYSNDLLIGEIEKSYTERLSDYVRFLSNLGLKPPFHWIAGITNTKGRHLAVPVPPGKMRIPTFKGPECLSETIVAEGAYNGGQTPGQVLAPFFETIFHKCGVQRTDYELQPL